MKYSTIAVTLLLTPSLFAQQPPKPSTPTPITVKSSPAEDALVKAAKEEATTRQTYETLRQQAISGLQNNQKEIAKKLQDAQNDLNEKLKADKKYKPLVDNIITLQSQISDASKAAQTNFDQKAGPLQQEMNTDMTLIQGLIPVVKQEQGLPDSATFDPATQKWTK